VNAPELVGDQWLGTGGRWLTLADLRGRIVLLDFWTLCCVNCHHVLAELEPLERRYADVLTVIGVHSPKFEHEKDAGAVAGAMQRHGIEHPVLNDPQMRTWEAYGARAWPTLVLISPSGEVVGRYSGEGHAHALDVALGELVAAGERDGTLVRGPGPFVGLEEGDAPYVQPSSALPLADGRLLVSDTGRSQIAIATVDDPNSVIARIGSGERALHDGDPGGSAFREPNGLTVLPSDVAERIGYDVVVADSGNHALRGLRLSDLTVRTIAGTGRQWMQGTATSGVATEVDLSTPWDVAWDGERVIIAMAGEHRLWWFEPVAGTVGVWAGTTHEGLVDGLVDEAWFAQSSAVAADDSRVWVIDAETSALRVVEEGRVRTPIGRGLFDFGHVDGPASGALLQHPLGLAVASDGSVLIADAYNGALRRYDVRTDEVTTLARGLAEPSDVLVLPGDDVLVVESAAGRVSRIPVGAPQVPRGDALRTRRPALVLAPGEVRVEVVFVPPSGQKRDERFGPSTQMSVGATPEALLGAGAGSGQELVRDVVIAEGVGEGVLHVAARGASCDEAGEHAACHMHQQDWGIPIVVDPAGSRFVRLELAG
jgi:thiol-disulfide isomerase/thioredoxin